MISMTTDNPAERLLIYQKLKHRLLTSPIPRGFCSLICWDLPLDVYLENLPELIAQCPDPEHLGAYWFTLDAEGTRQRIECLDRAIEKIKQQIS